MNEADDCFEKLKLNYLVTIQDLFTMNVLCILYFECWLSELLCV